MKRKILLLLTLTIIFSGLAATSTLAQRSPTRITIRQTETLLRRIDIKIDTLRVEAERFDQRNTNNGNSELFADQLTNLERSTTTLQDTLSSRTDMMSDLRDVMMNATLVDQFISRNRMSATVRSQWSSLKSDFSTLSTSNGLSWNWNQQTVRNPPFGDNMPTYIGTESQMRALVSRITTKTAIYKSQMVTALRIDRRADESDQVVTNYITRLQNAVNAYSVSLNSRRGAPSDVTEVLTAATYLDQFMGRNTLSSAAEAQWRNLRTELNSLARAYSLNWDWNQNVDGNANNNGGGGGTRFDAMLTGTYRLNTRMSEDTATVIDRALGSSSETDRDNRRVNLERRLRSPEMIAIDIRNETVQMASSLQPQVTFQADGVARAETNPRGRTTTTTATVDADGLIINYQGERANDFYLTFMPMNDGRLRVTRKIYLDNQEITVSSTYDKIDRTAQFFTVNNGTMNGGTTSGTFVVPNNTRLTAELTTPISSNANTFSMEVTSPGQYRRAVITGRIIPEGNGTRTRGTSRVLLVFETIRLANGRSYSFAGDIDSVTAVDGEVIQVTNQNANVRTTTQQQTPGGLLGALIGAIAGMPVESDANQSTTAGAVLVRRGDTFELASGTVIVLRSSDRTN